MGLKSIFSRYYCISPLFYSVETSPDKSQPLHPIFIQGNSFLSHYVLKFLRPSKSLEIYNIKNFLLRFTLKEIFSSMPNFQDNLVKVFGVEKMAINTWIELDHNWYAFSASIIIIIIFSSIIYSLWPNISSSSMGAGSHTHYGLLWLPVK